MLQSLHFLKVGLNYFQLGTTKELIPEEMWLRLVEWPGYLVLVLVSARKFTEEACFQNLVYQKIGRQDFYASSL